VSIPFLLDQNPNVASVGLDGEAVGPVRKVPYGPLGRTQSERRRRLSLAGGIRMSDGLSQDIANTVRALDCSSRRRSRNGPRSLGSMPGA